MMKRKGEKRQRTKGVQGVRKGRRKDAKMGWEENRYGRGGGRGKVKEMPLVHMI